MFCRFLASCCNVVRSNVYTCEAAVIVEITRQSNSALWQTEMLESWCEFKHHRHPGMEQGGTTLIRVFTEPRIFFYPSSASVT
jgi:hypothetical protein